MPIRIAPEIRIIGYLLFTVILYLFSSLSFYGLLFLVLCTAALSVPFRVLKSGWKPISLFLLFTFISNVIGQPGKIVHSMGGVPITDEGLFIAAVRTVRILLMIGAVKIFIANARTEEVISAIGRMLYPLERMGLPIRDFFHVMGLTVTCFPRIKETASELYLEHSQKESGNYDGKARMLTAFLIQFLLTDIKSPEIFFRQAEKSCE